MTDVGPSSGVKDYIINCRSVNMTDSQIRDNLKKSNWPEDVIEQAFTTANVVSNSVPESEEVVVDTNSQELLQDNKNA